MNERETAALQVEDLTYNADGLIRASSRMSKHVKC